jgi:Ca-activated chloride channel homolog
MSALGHARLLAVVLLAGSCGMHKGRAEMAAPSYAIADRSSSESYVDWGKNPWVDTAVDRLSTFAADVDTASYTIARRKLNEGTLPPTAAVRVEEFVNYFRYAFPDPAPGSPFAVIMDAAPSPLAPDHMILRVGVATRPRAPADRKPAHLVFLVDVSGSMASADKLPLAKQSLKLLTGNLGPRDTVALVTYAGSTRVVLPPTGIDDRSEILAAIDELGAGGSTAMASGLDLAYEQAMIGAAPGATSRVIVCTDGDTNVGPTGLDDMLRIIASRAQQGVTLSTVGFGMGNYKDGLMEQLADRGNGNSVYIDSLAAAKKVFQDELGATLEVVARDVKLQVDFDPAVVARYRLVGYENRTVADADFRNDKVDAGEIGPGHQVTAMYELALTDAGKQAPAPLGAVRIRYKAPDAGDPHCQGGAPCGDAAAERAFAMTAPPAASFDAAAPDLRFAFAVSAFADLLRGQDDARRWSLDAIAEVARATAGADPDRAELVSLIEKARRLRGTPATVAR